MQQRRADQGEADRSQRVLELGERHDLEVARVHVDERDTDREHGVASERVPHAGGAAWATRSLRSAGSASRPYSSVSGNQRSPKSTSGNDPAGVWSDAEELGNLGISRPKRVAHDARVHVRLAEHRRFALTKDRLAHDEVGGAREQHAQGEGADREA